MKTQIITLADHDDMVTIRDRMSWAKAPRILLIWPAHAQVALQPLDLRILQQHAARLGAQLGVVTRRGEIRRDATSFGIPVFPTTAEAQRGAWPRRRRASGRPATPRRHSAVELRDMSESLRMTGRLWSPRPVLRIAMFSLGVLAFLAVALLVIPRAEVQLLPLQERQSTVIVVEVGDANRAGVVGGTVASYRRTVTVSGTRTMPVTTRADTPAARATGSVEFQSLAAAPLVIPRGTIVYSAAPRLARFITLEEGALGEDTISSVKVAIEAVDAGEVGNVPAEAIQGIEGPLGAAASVSNGEPTSGGTNELQSVPSEADREKLRGILLDDLRAKAEEEVLGGIAANDVLLPGAIENVSIDEEHFEPAPGQPASLLSLELRVTFAAGYVKGSDLEHLAELSMDGDLPHDFEARPASLNLYVEPVKTDAPGQPARVEIRATRSIGRRIDAQQVNILVRGKTPERAIAALASQLPLGAPPAIRLTPSWWPWLPLIPFRIDVVIA